jgi:hypothetical protein
VGSLDYWDMVFASGVRLTEIGDFYLTEKELPGRQSGGKGHTKPTEVPCGESLRPLIQPCDPYWLSGQSACVPSFFDHHLAIYEDIFIS